MATLGQVRDALKERLDTIHELRVYSTWADVTNLPAAIVHPVSANYEVTMGDPDDAMFRFDIVVLVDQGNMRTAQNALDAYLGGSGDRSIRKTLLADPLLGGVSNLIFVRGFNNYQYDINVAGRQAVGASVNIEVMA